MPRIAKGPRLWLRKARRDANGRITHPAAWIVRDGDYQQGTGCLQGDRDGAEQALRDYIATKHTKEARGGSRDPADIPVADVLTIYLRDKAGKHARPHETRKRAEFLFGFFGADMLGTINGDRCRQYVAHRGSDAAARRELEDLRAAINHHRREGLCDKIVSVALPDESLPRERWLTRQEAAGLLLSAWRYREQQNFRGTDRHTRRHVARFVLVALYTGTRAGAICSAALQPTPGRGWIDLERGVFYRRASGARETKKRAPAIPLPSGLLEHLRRWKRLGQRYVVEWNGEPVKSIAKGHRAVVRSAGLGRDVTPHTYRHTAATWQMQAGTPVWEAAGFLGMSAELLWRRYGHHHPDYLSQARDAMQRRRTDAGRTAKPIPLAEAALRKRG